MSLIESDSALATAVSRSAMEVAPDRASLACSANSRSLSSCSRRSSSALSPTFAAWMRAMACAAASDSARVAACVRSIAAISLSRTTHSPSRSARDASLARNSASSRAMWPVAVGVPGSMKGPGRDSSSGIVLRLYSGARCFEC